jgi:putative endopeptidase
LKTKFLLAASAAAFAFAAPVAAHDDHACIDEACTMVSLIAAPEASAAAANASIAAPRMGSWGIDTAGMDNSVRPGADFFGYVSGNWARNTLIPADRSSFGGFAQLRDLSEARVRQLVESYRLGNPDTDGDQAKVAALYRSFLDEEAVERLGARPLQPLIQRISGFTTREQVAEQMGLSVGGIGRSFFGTSVFDDQRNPDRYALYMGQSGLGLSDRELYLDARFAPQKERYQQYVAQMLGLVGWAQPEAAAAAIVAMETRIAEAHWTRAESRNRDRTYNPMTLADLQREAPGFPWATFFRAAGIDHAERAVVSQNTAFPKIAQIFAEADVETLKAWQAFHAADNAAPLLSRQFVDAQFDFRSRFLQGQPEQRERWKRAVSFAEGAMGEAIGRDYVALYFPEESRRQMAELVDNLKIAMRHRIENLAWMTPATRQEALAKLATFNVKIGHPEEWRDYSGLRIVNGDLFGNAERAQRFEWDFRRARIGQPIDRAEWGMTPQTVNAYYSPVKNEIVFPAAILQPPFFDPQADPAVNYGAIGGVIGHEITHGFDDQGRKSDGNGMLRDWWTAEDAARFEAQAARLGAQYESYEFPTLPGMRINGRVSMGENIADLGGLLVAHDAYRASLAGRPAPVIDGFTGDQRFFMGWAQVWRTLWRDDALRQQIVNGPHSPGQIRAFAPLRNIDAWYAAFNVQPGDPLYIPAEERVRIW